MSRPTALSSTVLLCSLLTIGSTESARGVDLEAPLKAAYRDRGLVTAKEVSVGGVDVRYLEAGDALSSHLVVLLHGMAFRAATWQYCGTLDALADAGVRAIALDLPGYGGPYASPEVRKTLLARFVKAIGFAKRVVVVAASMGGVVGSPYVLSADAAVAGYVSASALLDDEAVAATGGRRSAVPALLVWGERDDPTSAKERAHEQLFATHELVVIPDAPHPAYLKEPGTWNALLLQFVAAGSSQAAGASMGASRWQGASTSAAATGALPHARLKAGVAAKWSWSRGGGKVEQSTEL